MTTTPTARLPYQRQAMASKRLTLVRCRWCNKPFAEVQAPTVVRFRCGDRGCRMPNEAKVVE